MDIFLLYIFYLTMVIIGSIGLCTFGVWSVLDHSVSGSIVRGLFPCVFLPQCWGWYDEGSGSSVRFCLRELDYGMRDFDWKENSCKSDSTHCHTSSIRQWLQETVYKSLLLNSFLINKHGSLFLYYVNATSYSMNDSPDH